MMCKKLSIKFFIILACLIYINSKVASNNPFDALGIPDINPKKILEELEQEDKPKEAEKPKVQLKTIDDLPNFLQKSNLSEDEGIEILTRFLIQDDLTLKKYGVVYDQTGFDGLAKDETKAPLGTEERLVQRARSAANIHVRINIIIISYLHNQSFITILYSSKKNTLNCNTTLMALKDNSMKLSLIGEYTKY